MKNQPHGGAGGKVTEVSEIHPLMSMNVCISFHGRELLLREFSLDQMALPSLTNLPIKRLD